MLYKSNAWCYSIDISCCWFVVTLLSTARLVKEALSSNPPFLPNIDNILFLLIQGTYQLHSVLFCMRTAAPYKSYNTPSHRGYVFSVYLGPCIAYACVRTRKEGRRGCFRWLCCVVCVWVGGGREDTIDVRRWEGVRERTSPFLSAFLFRNIYALSKKIPIREAVEYFSSTKSKPRMSTLCQPIKKISPCFYPAWFANKNLFYNLTFGTILLKV
jgi:hypothetical protein